MQLANLCSDLRTGNYCERKVTANGEEMPGVTVAVKGGTHGTITSIDGSYSLQVEAKSTLVFSFIGYETVEMPVKGQKVINVDLKESSVAIEEVVIAVPYGTAKNLLLQVLPALSTRKL